MTKTQNPWSVLIKNQGATVAQLLWEDEKGTSHEIDAAMTNAGIDRLLVVARECNAGHVVPNVGR